MYIKAMLSGKCKILIFLSNVVVALSSYYITQEIIASSDNSAQQVLIDSNVQFVDTTELEKKILLLTRDLAAANAALQSSLTDSDIEESNCYALSKMLDAKLYDLAINGLFSSDLNTREKTLKSLAQLGTDDAKDTLYEIILNNNEDTSLRIDLIRALDWHNSIDIAVNLLASKNESIASAIILAVQDSNLTESEQTYFEQQIMAIFNEDSGDFVQITALDYLANKNPEKISEIFIKSKNTEVTEKINLHIKVLTESINNTSIR